jgi:hypothetical protein
VSKFYVFLIHVIWFLKFFYEATPKGCSNAPAQPDSDGQNIVALILLVANIILFGLIPTNFLHSPTRHGNPVFDCYSGIHIVELSTAVGLSDHELPSILM